MSKFRVSCKHRDMEMSGMQRHRWRSAVEREGLARQGLPLTTTMPHLPFSSRQSANCRTLRLLIFLSGQGLGLNPPRRTSIAGAFIMPLVPAETPAAHAQRCSATHVLLLFAPATHGRLTYPTFASTSLQHGGRSPAPTRRSSSPWPLLRRQWHDAGDA